MFRHSKETIDDPQVIRLLKPHSKHILIRKSVGNRAGSNPAAFTFGLSFNRGQAWKSKGCPSFAFYIIKAGRSEGSVSGAVLT